MAPNPLFSIVEFSRIFLSHLRHSSYFPYESSYLFPFKSLDRALRERNERTSTKNIGLPYVRPELITIKPPTDVPQVPEYRTEEVSINMTGKPATLNTDNNSGQQVSTQILPSSKSSPKDLTLELSSVPYYAEFRNNSKNLISQDSYSPDSQSSTYNLLPTTQASSLYPSSKSRRVSQPVAPRRIYRQVSDFQDKYTPQQRTSPAMSSQRVYRQSSISDFRGPSYSPSKVTYHNGLRESSPYHERRTPSSQKSYRYDAMNGSGHNSPNYSNGNYGGYGGGYYHS
ncbi:hypothetical protein ACKWTF_013524 [Chironomus riparius]